MAALLQLNKEQQDAVTHVYEYGQTYLIAPMGAGKTAVALTAMDELIRDLAVKRVLVIAPLKVCQQVWQAEAVKWQVDKRLNIGLATAYIKSRTEIIQDPKYNVVLLNFENVAWFFHPMRPWYKLHLFDMLVIDEVTKFKAGGVGFKKLRRYIPTFNTRLVMSGTPVAESWEGLFYPFMCVDNGTALGRNKQKFLERYFLSDYNGYNWTLRDGASTELYDRINGAIVNLPSYEHELPPITYHTKMVSLTEVAKLAYGKMARDFMLNTRITAANAAVKTGKLQQIACGFIYPDDDSVVHLHINKTKALFKLLVFNIPTVIVYQFKEEKNRLENLLGSDITFNVEDWQAGKAIFLGMHPRSAGHGISLTRAERLIFMSPIWSRDLTRQTIGRVWRRGQTKPVTIYTLLTEGTIDEEIHRREGAKSEHHSMLQAHIKLFKQQPLLEE